MSSKLGVGAASMVGALVGFFGGAWTGHALSGGGVAAVGQREYRARIAVGALVGMALGAFIGGAAAAPEAVAIKQATTGAGKPPPQAAARPRPQVTQPGG